LNFNTGICTNNDLNLNGAITLHGIKFVVFKFLPEEAKRYLLGIFNEIMSTGKIPESWLRTKVVPILNLRKDPELSDSYRPISLLPCTRKLLEKMLYPSGLKIMTYCCLAIIVFEKAGRRRIV
jgi:hypothetical protein